MHIWFLDFHVRVIINELSISDIALYTKNLLQKLDEYKLNLWRWRHL